jgi:DnaJ-class molecular chaperone
MLKTEISDLTYLTDEQLQDEINRRTKEKEDRRKQELELRNVVIYCPNCAGSGKVQSRSDMYYSTNEHNCDVCKGKGTIKGLKVE